MPHLPSTPAGNDSDGEILRGPMTDCLARIMGELPAALDAVNVEVQEKAGIPLELKCLETREVSPEKWVVKIEGNTCAGWPITLEFVIQWMASTTPAHFHISEIGGEGSEGYAGISEAFTHQIAKNLAILTHRQQILGVLAH